MFKQALDRRAEQGRPIQVGFVGAGRMGTGAICQIGLMKGIRDAIIADISTERVVRAFELSGCRREDVLVRTRCGRADAIQAGKPVVTQDAILSELPIDAVVEATGNPDFGARVLCARSGPQAHHDAQCRDRRRGGPDPVHRWPRPQAWSTRCRPVMSRV